MQINELKSPYNLPGYQVSIISVESIQELQVLLERCVDYNLLVSGDSPTATAAQSLLTNFPPGRSNEDKVVFGISAIDGSLVGVLDAMRDYPQDECWWVGLLMLDPMSRNQGLGQQIYHFFEEWVRQLGAKYIFLGVIEENERAYRFWLRMGFEVVEKQPPQQFGLKEHVVITMVRYLVQ